MQIKNDNGEHLSNDIGETKSSDCVKSRSRLEQIVMIVLIVIFILVNVQYILIVRRNYNHRFDAGAQASGSFELTLSSGVTKSDTFTVFAGQVTYRFSQKEGETPTEYLLKYKRVGDSGDCIPLRTITVTANGEYIGYFELASSNYCQRYSLYCERLDDGNGASTIEIDWGVNFNR